MQSSPGGSAPAQVGPLNPSPAAAPQVKVDDQGRTSFDLSVSGATKGQPFWLVLGQSDNRGLDRVGRRPRSGPAATGRRFCQRMVDRSRRRRRQGGVALDATTQRVDRARAVGGRGAAVSRAGHPPAAARWRSRSTNRAPQRVTWRTFLRSRGREEPSVRIALLTGAIAGVVAAAVIGLAAGAVTAVAVGVATRRRRARWWLALGRARMARAQWAVRDRASGPFETDGRLRMARRAVRHPSGRLAGGCVPRRAGRRRRDLGPGQSPSSRTAAVAVASARSGAASVPSDDDDPRP